MRYGLIILFSTALAQEVAAQGCCTGGVPLMGTYTLSDVAASSWEAGLTYDHHSIASLFIESDKLDQSNVTRRSQSVLAQVRYGISQRFSVSLLASYIWLREQVADNQADRFEASGAGDVQFTGQYTLVNSPQWQWVGGAGVIIPVANTRHRQGEFVLPPSLQPGIGAFSAVGYTSVSLSPGFRPQMTFTQSVFYRIHGTSHRFANVSSYRFGSIFQSFTSVADQFAAGTFLHTPSLTVQAKWQQYDALNDQINDNTGGVWIFLMPGYRVSWSPDFQTFLQAEVPLYRRVNGFQITTTYRLTVGINYTL